MLFLQEDQNALTRLKIIPNSSRNSLKDAFQSDSPSPLLCETIQQLNQYFQRDRNKFDLPLAPQGTPFQQKVWKILQQIPYASTWSYKELALHVGGVNYSRAVGNANAKNPLPLFIPCHRVIALDGSLGGFSAGLENKATLLRLEGGDF